MTQVYLSLQSSRGERQQHLNHALALLSEHLQLGQQSAIYEAEPLEYPHQDWALCQAIEVNTQLSASALLEQLQQIENTLEPERGERWGPHQIDLDILLYGDEIVCNTHLQIPHLRLHLRACMLVPLMEIAPQANHPVLNKTTRELFDTYAPTTLVKRWEVQTLLV